MISKPMQEAINEQINAELYSAYLYYSMYAFFESQSLSGCAQWMKIQALEEVSHTQKLAAFVNERGGRVLMKAIAGPPTEWESPVAAFEAAYEHETKVSAMINKLVDLSIKEGDHAANNFLQWFVAEQVEEEASADEVVQKLKLAGSHGLFHVDQELARRTFVIPPELPTQAE